MKIHDLVKVCLDRLKFDFPMNSFCFGLSCMWLSPSNLDPQALVYQPHRCPHLDIDYSQSVGVVHLRYLFQDVARVLPNSKSKLLSKFDFLFSIFQFSLTSTNESFTKYHKYSTICANFEEFWCSHFSHYQCSFYGMIF